MSYFAEDYVAEGYSASPTGTLFWVAYLSSGSTPTALQIVNAQNATGAAALASGVEEYTADGTYDESTAISVLNDGTGYKVAWTIYNGSAYGNVTESDEIITFPGPPEITVPAPTVVGTTVTLSVALTF